MPIETLKKEYEKLLLEVYDYKFSEIDPPLYNSEYEYRYAYKKALIKKSESIKKVIRKY